MKKALALLALSMVALNSSAAEWQRLYISGYRIGESEVFGNDEGLIVATNRNEEVKTDYIALIDNRLASNAWFSASVPKGEEVLRWIAYDKDPTPPNCLSWPPTQTNSFAGAVTECVWSYNPKDAANRYIVVDYDYITYKLHYNGNGGGGSMTNETYIYTNEFRLAARAFSRTGYTFECWTNKVGASFADQALVGGESFGVDYANKAETLFAKWRPHAYTVKFNKNTSGSVSGEMPPMSLTYDVSSNLTRNAFVRKGYWFDGWAKTSRGAKSYEDENQIVNLTTEDGGVVELYAVWQAKEFSIEYHRNDGSDATQMQTEQFYGGNVEILSTPPRVGFNFMGWATSLDGTVAYKAGNKYSVDPGDEDVIHLYAVWAPVEYTIAFGANGGEGDMPGALVRYGEEFTLPDCGFTKAGDFFKGWTTNVADGVEFNAGDSVSNLATTASSVVTFYAVWSEPRYVAFAGNGADVEGAMAEDTMVFEGVETKPLAPNKFEKTGYTFAGWATNAAAAAFDVEYTNCEEVVGTDLWMPIGETNVLYAVWLTNTYTVVFDPNGGRGTMESQPFVYDQSQELAMNRFVSTLAFGGWATSEAGGAVYDDKAIVSNLTAEANGTFTLYAVWNNGLLSQGMHCDNLIWDQSEVESSSGMWGVVEGTNEGYGASGSSVFATLSETCSYGLKVISSNAKSGRISFWYKMSSGKPGDCRLEFTADDKDAITIEPSTEWQQFGPIEVEEMTGCQLLFYLNPITASEDSYTVWIDQMTWVPSSTIELAEDGWQKVMFGALPDDPSPTNVFAAVADKVDRVVLGGRSWSPGNGGRLSVIGLDMPYWVHTTDSNVVWTVSGAGNPKVEEDAYGPFGRGGDIDEDALALKPTVYDVSLTFGGNAGAAGDCIAAYSKVDDALCGLGMVYEANGEAKCDMVLYAGAGTNIHFRAWRSGTPDTAILDVDDSCDITAPAPGTIVAEKTTLTVAARMYTVSFAGNGGTGTMKDQKVQEGVPIALNANAFTKSGYLFAGWKDKDGKDYADCGQIVATSDVTLTAQWEKIVVSCSPTSTNFHWRATGGGTLAGRFDVVCNTGWTAGSQDPWLAITSGASGSGDGSVEYSLEDNTAAGRTGTITVTSTDAAGLSATFTVTQDGRASAPSIVIEGGVLKHVDMEGYHDCEIPGTVTTIAADAFKDGAEVYVVRIPASVTNICDGAFAGCANLTNVEFYGDAPAAGEGIFSGTPSGLTLTVRSGKSGWPEAGATWPEGDPDARTVSVLERHVVSFDWNGRDDGPATNITVDAGESCALPFFELYSDDANAHGQNREGVRPGYVFGGWNATGSADDGMESFDAFVPASNVTLRARWVPNVYVFRFDANGGKPTGGVVGQKFGDGWTAVQEPSLAGSAFGGWWTAKTGGEEVDLGGTCSVVGNLASATTLYARWRKAYKATAKDGTVSAGGGDPATSLTVPEGTELCLKAVDKGDKDMVFSKWTVSPATAELGDGYNPRSAETSFSMPGSAVTFTANYVAKPGYVRLSAYEVNDTANAVGDPEGVEWSDDGKIWMPVGYGVSYPVKTGKTVALQFRATDPRWTVPAKATYNISAGGTNEIAVAATRTTVVAADYDDASGTVTTSPKNGQVLGGKPVTLTAKAGKDSVFAYWLVGEEKVGYTATLKYAPEEDSVVTAVFRPKSAVAAPEFDEEAVEQSAAVVGVAYNASVPVVDEAYPAKFTAKNLPAGLKIDVASGSIAGVPTKAGAYDVEISAKGGANGKATSSYILHIDVAELPLWAQGAFVGSVKLEEELGSATMTVAANGKISGKIALDGTNWTFSAVSFSRVESDPSSEVGSPKSYFIEAVAKAGKATRDLVLEVAACDGGALGDRALPNGVAEGSFGEGDVKMWRNMWKDKSTAAEAKTVLADFEGVYTVSIADGADYGSGYMSLTVGKNGDVKASGKLADGTGVSATSPLMYDEEAGWFAMLYVAPSAYKGGAFAAAVGFGELLEWVMFAPQWSSRNPQATGEYGEGFEREVDLAGAYYDKLEKLNAYYEALRLDLDGTPELGFNYKETLLNEQGRKVTTSYASTASAVDTLSQPGLTATVNEKGAIVVEKATKPVQDRETKEWSYDGANDGGLTLSFTQATGIFKGSYTFWYDYVSAYDETTDKETLAHSSKKVSFEGILVQGEDPKMDGFYLWDATGEYEDEKTGKAKTYKYKQSYAVTIEQQAQQQ